jgi:hypothetical protein
MEPRILLIDKPDQCRASVTVMQAGRRYEGQTSRPAKGANLAPMARVLHHHKVCPAFLSFVWSTPENEASIGFEN